MRAVVCSPEKPEPRVVEVEQPVPDDGEVLVRTLYIGIDGSDRRIAAGKIGGDPPEGEDHLILGHEAVGVVEDTNGTAMAEGTIVAPLVRVPHGHGSRYAENGELDVAPPGSFHERGIIGAHGYMAEYFTSDPEHLVPVPESRAEYGFFVEPVSILEKSLDQTYAARSSFDWRPESALVLGNGNLGLTALARLATTDDFDRTYCLGRRDRPDPTIDFIEDIGATYVDSRETPLETVPETNEPVDYIFETTGYPPHVLNAVSALAPNGVATLQGIPEESTHEVDVGTFHSELVTTNKALLGVVNSRRSHFEAAAEWVAGVPRAVLDSLISDVYGVEDAAQAFDDSPETMKTVVSFT